MDQEQHGEVNESDAEATTVGQPLPQRGFWASYQAFRRQFDLESLDIEPEKISGPFCEGGEAQLVLAEPSLWEPEDQDPAGSEPG
jgi:hypothetical protein